MLVLTRTLSGQHHNVFAGDFKDILIRTLPGPLSRLILPLLHPFCFLRDVYSATGSSVKLDAFKNNYCSCLPHNCIDKNSKN